jgi:sulfate adenylyltransferase
MRICLLTPGWEVNRASAAAETLRTLSPRDLRITPLLFENAAYCTRCAQMVTRKTCPHPADDWLQLSGSKVRAMLREGVRH